LADFVVDWTSPTQNPDEEIPTPWIVQRDGAWCYKGVGISAVVTSPAGVVIRYAARLIFANNEQSTNNTTEYEALLLALTKMKPWVSKPSSSGWIQRLFKDISRKRMKQGILS
jgi:ribonuclease HI